LFHEKWFIGNYFFKHSYICLPLEKIINGKYYLLKEKFGLISKKIFSFYFIWKTLSRSCEKKLEMHGYLLIISNLIINLFNTLYFVLNPFLFNFTS
jgi:hypothetical protein